MYKRPLCQTLLKTCWASNRNMTVVSTLVQIICGMSHNSQELMFGTMIGSEAMLKIRDYVEFFDMVVKSV